MDFKKYQKEAAKTDTYTGRPERAEKFSAAAINAKSSRSGPTFALSYQGRILIFRAPVDVRWGSA
jgi:hypothetical protein